MGIVVGSIVSVSRGLHRGLYRGLHRTSTSWVDIARRERSGYFLATSVQINNKYIQN